MLFLISFLITFLVGVITFYKWKYQFWKKHNLPCLEPTIPWGNVGNPYSRTITFMEVIKDFYNEFKIKGYKHGGIYVMANPIYIPVDLEYVKNILTKDFAYFTDRGIFYNERDDPLTAHLFSVEGTKWRNLRVKLTPTFTSGKMKTMFNTLVECSELFQTAMERLVDSKEPIDIKDALGCFTTDVIGSCAFGLECNSIKDKDSPFRFHGKNIFTRSRLRNFVGALVASFPKISKAIHFRSVPRDTSDFFMKVVRDTVEYREKNNVIRNDFMQMLIDLKNNKLDEEIKEKHDGKSLTLNEIAAQCFVFFLAGFETSSTVMTFALFELSRNRELQDKARKEVLDVIKKHDGKITYEAIGEMKYLSQVIDESMRLYPPGPLLLRQCVKDYKVPDSDVTIPEGTKVFISTYGIQKDPDYFPDPELFDPERFSDENKKSRHPYAFLPFGEGPRNCIGLRFGLMQSKVGLATLLKNYKFTLDEKTKVPITFSRSSIVTTAEGGIWLRAERL